MKSSSASTYDKVLPILVVIGSLACNLQCSQAGFQPQRLAALEEAAAKWEVMMHFLVFARHVQRFCALGETWFEQQTSRILVIVQNNKLLLRCR